MSSQAFGRRISAPLEVIHSRDPSVLEVDATVLDSYLLSRDISRLPAMAVAGASVLTCRPLLAKYEHLAHLAQEPVAMRALFRHHVCAARGPAAAWLQFESREGSVQLTEASAEECSLEFLSEFVAVILQAPSRRGDASPFSPLDGWRQERRHIARAKALAALCASTPDAASTTEAASDGSNPPL
jgi:hypothetical protein